MRLSIKQKIFLSITGVLLAVATGLGILGAQGIAVLPIGWSTGVPIGLTGAAAIFALLAIPLNKRPPADPLGIQGRPPFLALDSSKVPNETVKAIYEQLIRNDVTGIALTGICGAGTTTLAGQIYYYVQEQQRKRKGYFTDPPLWLNVPSRDPNTRVSCRTFLEALKPNADFDKVSDTASKLLEILKDKKRLVIFNQFENLLDMQTSRVEDVSMRQCLDRVNNDQSYQCRILITSHFYPQGDDRGSPLHLVEYRVEGIGRTGGMKLLKDLLQKHRIIRATESSLCKVVEQCGGHPRALQQLESVLSHTADKDLDRFIQNQSIGSGWSQWKDDIATQFLESSYRQNLSQGTLAYEFLLALCIYREPVKLDAVVPIRDAFRNAPQDILRAIFELTRHCLTQFSDGCYKLHPIFVTYAQHHFAENDTNANSEARRQAHEKAAVYYQSEANRHPLQSSERKHLLIEAAWHQLQAGHLQEAYSLLDADTLESLLHKGERRW